MDNAGSYGYVDGCKTSCPNTYYGKDSVCQQGTSAMICGALQVDETNNICIQSGT